MMSYMMSVWGVYMCEVFNQMSRFVEYLQSWVSDMFCLRSSLGDTKTVIQKNIEIWIRGKKL